MKANAKPYNTPFWLMLVIALLTAGFHVGAYFILKDVAKYSRRQLSLYSFWSFFWPILLFTEAIIYRLLKNKIVKKSFTWHIITTFLCFFILPFSQIIVTTLIGRASMSRSEYLQVTTTVGWIEWISFWILLSIGHAFFITTIAKSFKRKEAEDNEQAPGILDGIIDKY